MYTVLYAERAEKLRTLSSLKTSLVIACTERVAHFKESSFFPGLRVNSSRNKKSAQPDSGQTADGIRRKLKVSNLSAADTLLSFVAPSTD